MKYKNLFIIILINAIIKLAFSSDLLTSVANELKLNYKKSLLYKNQSLIKTNLKLFQYDLIKIRNAECLYKYYRSFDYSSYIKFTNASFVNQTRWTQDSNGFNHTFIVDTLNKIVSF